MSGCVGSAETSIQTRTFELFSKAKFCPRGALPNYSAVYYNCCIQSGSIGYTSCCSRTVFCRQLQQTNFINMFTFSDRYRWGTGKTGDVSGTGIYLIFKPYTGFLLEYRYTTVYYSQTAYENLLRNKTLQNSVITNIKPKQRPICCSVYQNLFSISFILKRWPLSYVWRRYWDKYEWAWV